MISNLNNINKSLKISILLFIICFPISFHNVVFSQISADSYAEVGSNAVSQGVYGDFSVQLLGRFGSFSANTGGLMSFSNARENIFAAYSFVVSNDFLILKKKINIGSFYLWKPFSTDLREYNFGLLAYSRIKHFGYTLGFNSRIYSFTRAAIARNNFADTIKTSVWEPVNFMYKLSFYHQFNPKLNFEASITNYDRYFILQETNPMILTKLSYYLNSKLQFYSELGYMQAGLLNMHVNYFGIYFRGGAVWRIN